MAVGDYSREGAPEDKAGNESPLSDIRPLSPLLPPNPPFALKHQRTSSDYTVGSVRSIYDDPFHYSEILRRLEERKDPLAPSAPNISNEPPARSPSPAAAGMAAAETIPTRVINFSRPITPASPSTPSFHTSKACQDSQATGRLSSLARSSLEEPLERFSSATEASAGDKSPAILTPDGSPRFYHDTPAALTTPQSPPSPSPSAYFSLDGDSPPASPVSPRYAELANSPAQSFIAEPPIDGSLYAEAFDLSPSAQGVRSQPKFFPQKLRSPSLPIIHEAPAEHYFAHKKAASFPGLGALPLGAGTDPTGKAVKIGSLNMFQRRKPESGHVFPVLNVHSPKPEPRGHSPRIAQPSPLVAEPSSFTAAVASPERANSDRKTDKEARNTSEGKLAKKIAFLNMVRRREPTHDLPEKAQLSPRVAEPSSFTAAAASLERASSDRKTDKEARQTSNNRFNQKYDKLEWLKERLASNSLFQRFTQREEQRRAQKAREAKYNGNEIGG